MRGRKPYIATWEHMEQQGLDPEAEASSWEPLVHAMGREEFEACASTLRAKGTGKVSALVFPLWSRVLKDEEYDALDSDDRCRCVRRPAEEGTGWLYAPQTYLDGVYGGLPCINLYLANSVRLARADETANCRIMLDWEYAKYPAAEKVYAHRLVLVSTGKTEKGHEWRLDRAFAERNAVGEESAEESLPEEEEEEPERTRPKRIPGGVPTMSTRNVWWLALRRYRCCWARWLPFPANTWRTSVCITLSQVSR